MGGFFLTAPFKLATQLRNFGHKKSGCGTFFFCFFFNQIPRLFQPERLNQGPQKEKAENYGLIYTSLEVLEE